MQCKAEKNLKTRSLAGVSISSGILVSSQQKLTLANLSKIEFIGRIGIDHKFKKGKIEGLEKVTRREAPGIQDSYRN